MFVSKCGQLGQFISKGRSKSLQSVHFFHCSSGKETNNGDISENGSISGTASSSLLPGSVEEMCTLNGNFNLPWRDGGRIVELKFFVEYRIDYISQTVEGLTPERVNIV